MNNLRTMHPGNRFRLMFGHPLLPDNPMRKALPYQTSGDDYIPTEDISKTSRLMLHVNGPVGVIMPVIAAVGDIKTLPPPPTGTHNWNGDVRAPSLTPGFKIAMQLRGVDVVHLITITHGHAVTNGTAEKLLALQTA
jgi:hypothetical protein